MYKNMEAVLICTVTMGVFIVLCLDNVITWYKNNHAPIEVVHAIVCDKKRNMTLNGLSATLNTFYASFRLENGEVKEFPIDSVAYYGLEEGQSGELTYQGSRFLRYDRDEN